MRERQTVSILIIIGDDPVCSVCSVVNKRHQRAKTNENRGQTTLPSTGLVSKDLQGIKLKTCR